MVIVWTGEGESSSFPVLSREVGGFRTAWVELGGKGISTTHPSAPLSTRHHKVGWKKSLDRGNKITNRER